MEKQAIQKVIEELSKVKGARFVSLTYRSKETGELARHTVNIGIDIERVYNRARMALARKMIRLSGVTSLACGELVKSLDNSLDKGIGNNDAYTQKETYEHVLPNISFHRETGTFYLSGFARSKVVLEKGEERKPTNSSEKTLAKNGLKKLVGLDKFRKFILKAENLESIRANGKTIEIS